VTQPVTGPRSPMTAHGLGLLAGSATTIGLIIGFILLVFLQLGEYRDRFMIVLSVGFAAVILGSIGFAIARLWSLKSSDGNIAGAGHGLFLGAALGIGIGLLIVGTCNALGL